MQQSKQLHQDETRKVRMQATSRTLRFQQDVLHPADENSCRDNTKMFVITRLGLKFSCNPVPLTFISKQNVMRPAGIKHRKIYKWDLVRFQFPTTTNMNMDIFRLVTSRNLVEIYRCLRRYATSVIPSSGR